MAHKAEDEGGCGAYEKRPSGTRHPFPNPELIVTDPR
jgi:hypothetical protein